MKDADGDEASGKITINVEKPVVIPERPKTLELDDEHLVVDEKEMASDEGAKAGIAIVDKDGKEYTISEVLEDGYFGNVVQNEDGSWSYKLNTAFSHDAGDGRNTQVNGDYVKLKVVDEDGNEYVVNRKVDIIDDIPEMSLSECDLGKVMAGSESAVTGKLEYGFGADAGDGAKLVVTVDGQEIELESGKENIIQGKYGELVIAADGSYAYRAKVNAAGQDSFQFRIEDADGDIVDADASGKSFDVVVNIVEKKEPEPGEITVNERDLRGGGPASADLAVDGFEIVGVVANGARGEAALVDGKWVYTLDGAIDHSEQGADTAKGADTVVLKVRDEFGNEYEVEKTVNVIDDTPEMSVTGGGTIRGGETASGTIAHEFGADGAGQLVVSFGGKDYVLNEGEETVINGKFGDLTFNGDGTWDYRANEDNRFGRDNFQLKIVDGDGDLVDSEAGAGVLIGEKKPYEIDINVLPENVDVDPSIIYEQELAFGDIKLDVDVDGWTIVGATPQGHAGTMVKDALGNWQYVLKNALNHDNGVNIVDTVRLTLRNENGVTVEVDKRIDIVDDKPRLSLERIDVPLADGIVVNETDLRNGGHATVKLDGEGYEIVGVNKNGSYGTVKQINGEWFYELNKSVKHSEALEKNVDYFYLKVRDENGYVRKIEVGVDVIDDQGPRDTYSSIYLAPGQTYSETFSRPSANGENSVDGYGDPYMTAGRYMTDSSNWTNTSLNAIKINWTMPTNITSIDEYIFNGYMYWKENDLGKLQKNIYFHHVNYNVTPVKVVKTDNDDFINPNPKFNEVSNQETTDSYWTPTSKENIIYGCGGNDLILAEGLYFAADEQYKVDTINDFYGNKVLHNELLSARDLTYSKWAEKYQEIYEDAEQKVNDLFDMYLSGEIDIYQYVELSAEPRALQNWCVNNQEYSDYNAASSEYSSYMTIVNSLDKGTQSTQQLAQYFPDLIYGGSGNDKIYLSGAGGVVFGDGTDNSSEDVYSKLMAACGMNCKFYDMWHNLMNKSFDELLKIAEIAERFESSSDGNDSIYTGNFSVIFGGGGDDSINSYTFSHTVNLYFGGSGNDRISQAAYAFGGSGDDVISNSTYAFGGDGDDHIKSCVKSFSGAGNDIFSPSYTFSPELYVKNGIFIDGGEGIDIIALPKPSDFNGHILSDGLKYGIFKDVEICFSGAMLVIDDLFEEGTGYEIFIDYDNNTLELGDSWEYLAGSETGINDYHTKSYVYHHKWINNGIEYNADCILETVLDVTNNDTSLSIWDAHQAVLSGHEAEIPGRITYSFGMDTGSSKKLVAIVNGEEHELVAGQANSITGIFGTLTMSREGIFSYNALANVEGQDEFIFQIYDSDGSAVTTEINDDPLRVVVDVEKPEPPVVTDVAINEIRLESGNPVLTNLYLNGYTIDNVTMDGGYGEIYQAGNYWYHRFSHNMNHDGNMAYTDIVHITYRDGFGNTYQVDKNIKLVDSAPEVGNIEVNLINVFEYEGDSLIDSDVEFFYDFHADDDADKVSITCTANGETVKVRENEETTISGKAGDMTFVLSNGNINFFYKMDEKAEEIENFTFTFTDSDGSVASNHIEIRTRFSVDLYEREMTDEGLTAHVSLPAWLTGNNKIIDVEYQGHAGYTYQDENGNWYYHLDKSLFDEINNPDTDVVQDDLVIWYRDENGVLANVINKAFVFEKSVINPKADCDSLNGDDEMIAATSLPDVNPVDDIDAENGETENIDFDKLGEVDELNGAPKSKIDDTVDPETLDNPFGGFEEQSAASQNAGKASVKTSSLEDADYSGTSIVYGENNEPMIYDDSENLALEKGLNDKFGAAADEPVMAITEPIHAEPVKTVESANSSSPASEKVVSVADDLSSSSFNDVSVSFHDYSADEAANQVALAS